MFYNNLRKLENYLRRTLKSYIIKRSYGLGSAHYIIEAGNIELELEFIYGDLFRAPMLSFHIITRDERVAKTVKKYFGNWIKITKLDDGYLLILYSRNLWSGISLSPNDYEEDKRQIKLIKYDRGNNWWMKTGKS